MPSLIAAKSAATAFFTEAGLSIDSGDSAFLANLVYNHPGRTDKAVRDVGAYLGARRNGLSDAQVETLVNNISQAIQR